MYHTKTVKGGCFIRPVLFCGDIPKPMEDTLSSLGYRILRLPPDDSLPAPVNCHPDMLMAELPSGKLVISRSYFDKNEAILSDYRSFFEFSDDTLGKTYPEDVKLNALKTGNTLFCGKTASKTLTEQYGKVVTVKQGYTHCAACKIGKGVVTADPSLCKALIAEGIDTLLISSGHIILKPYNTGFIGGASLMLKDTLTVFFGKVEAHPDYKKIRDFAHKHGADILSLSDEPLSDFGGGYIVSDENT